MLTAQQIEDQDYSTNDVADLLMRLQIATTALCFVADELSRSESGNTFVKEAHEVALNSWGRVQHEHTCNVEAQEDGTYRCQCDLIATAE